ncbi:hypothetical protein SK128_003996 [Halocaridina rubra]|uniref:Uncharacterized protein n=1 Tax=Halocaridina rubra TaxID=373956 RepID=A0AAN9ABF2_HALRR
MSVSRVHSYCILEILKGPVGSVGGDAMLSASGQQHVNPLQVSWKVLVKQEDVIHDLDAVQNTLQSHVTSEIEEAAGGGCEAHGSSAVFEPAIWHDKRN